MHVGNGMYGLILVEPKEGLPPVDREYYVMQGDFYTTGKYGEEGLQAFDMNKAIDERPTYVVFNGAVGSLVGDKALTAKVGEKIRLFVGNGGPNLTSSFHVIGEIFDTVYQEGGTQPSHNVQTTVIPPGGAAIVEFQVQVPGTYILVDHALFRAFNKGALGMLKVDGPQDQLVYSGKEVDAVYLGKAAEAGSEAEKRVAALKAAGGRGNQEQPEDRRADQGNSNREGQGGVYADLLRVPPTGRPGCRRPDSAAGQIRLPRELTRTTSIRGVLMGRTGEIVVNGKTYNGIMVPLNYLSDEQIANVLTYVRNSWGNSGDAVTVEEVTRIRQEAAPPPARADLNRFPMQRSHVRLHPSMSGIRHRLRLAVLVLCATAARAADPAPPGMARIPDGVYRPLFRAAERPEGDFRQGVLSRYPAGDER